ncbi:MAG: restriction endonuclease [Deltaproteobacteria bacterium]|nr:restriction endonuclease [Deltaproteobacteria bacterium]
MQINWKELNPRDFEKFCYHVLELNDFSNIQWHGKSGGDRGRDLTATKIESPLPSIEKYSSWVIQCKRYIAKPPSKDEISSFLNSAREFKPDNVLLIISNTLTSNAKDWIKSIKGEFQFNIYLWEEQNLITQIIRHRDVLSEYFPENEDFGKQVVFFKINPGGIRLGCNEFQEVDLFCTNASNYEEAKKIAYEYVKFIKEHNIIFE